MCAVGLLGYALYIYVLFEFVRISPTFRDFLGNHADPRIVRIRTPFKAGS